MQRSRTRNWSEADAIRDQLKDAGIVLEDSPPDDLAPRMTTPAAHRVLRVFYRDYDNASASHRANPSR